MKIRIGFVSNSSSSNFVVAFPRKPKSVKDLKKMMFGKQEWHYIGYSGVATGPQDHSAQEIVEAVFKDIKKKATEKEIYESIRWGWFDAFYENLFPGYYSDIDETSHLQWPKDKKKIESIRKKTEKINDKRAKNIANAFIRSHDKEFIVVLRYCDENSSFESILEHTNIFNRIDHIITSYH